jgi:hypothetical protein
LTKKIVAALISILTGALVFAFGQTEVSRLSLYSEITTAESLSANSGKYISFYAKAKSLGTLCVATLNNNEKNFFLLENVKNVKFEEGEFFAGKVRPISTEEITMDEYFIPYIVEVEFEDENSFEERFIVSRFLKISGAVIFVIGIGILIFPVRRKPSYADVKLNNSEAI